MTQEDIYREYFSKNILNALRKSLTITIRYSIKHQPLAMQAKSLKVVPIKGFITFPGCLFYGGKMSYCF